MNAVRLALGKRPVFSSRSSNTNTGTIRSACAAPASAGRSCTRRSRRNHMRAVEGIFERTVRVALAGHAPGTQAT